MPDPLVLRRGDVVRYVNPTDPDNPREGRYVKTLRNGLVAVDRERADPGGRSYIYPDWIVDA